MSTKTVQIVSISSALTGAGGIASLSLFDVPLLQSQPASRSLPSIRWLFSRGSHVFPQAASLSSAGFAYLAYDALPSGNRTLSSLLNHINGSTKVSMYLVAAALTISIGPVTQFLMVPTNFTLIEKNEEKGGARSEKSQTSFKKGHGRVRSAVESVEGKGDVNEFKDLSGPQEKTTTDTSEEENEEVRGLLTKFANLNALRSVLMAVGGIVGLAAALT